jgi:hypothetical protein
VHTRRDFPETDLAWCRHVNFMYVEKPISAEEYPAKRIVHEQP